ncbi:MAG: Gfo/Idh/MocA family oxidoreductase [Armatimonadaceae bacterium]
MSESRFALLGAGFWARYQLAAWREVPGATCVAICDPDRDKAAYLADLHQIPHVYTSLEELLSRETPDFVDIVTPPKTHKDLVLFCASKGLPAICQKPMAETVEDAAQMVAACEAAEVPFLIHENWRWQRPLRTAGDLIRQGAIGNVFRARLTFSCSFPVFDNQPFLRELPQFILTDIGSHVLDSARFLFGEAKSVYCQTRNINPTIRGEDVATVMMPMGRDGEVTVICEMSYASRTEYERFPQTYLFVEGDGGSLEIAPDYIVKVTDRTGTWQEPQTTVRRCPPPRYPWADPAYDLVQASMVPCLTDLFGHLSGKSTAETTGKDNLETVRLIFAAYESADTGKVVATR